MSADVNIAELFGTLPLSTPAEFKDFQDLLDEEITEQFITLLVSLGGKDLQQFIHNMLRKVMNDHLATSFSFSGKAMAGVSKAAFCKTKVCRCIIEAAQRVYGLQEATNYIVSSMFAKWLQMAKFRIERRGKKRTYMDAQEENYSWKDADLCIQRKSFVDDLKSLKEKRQNVGEETINLPELFRMLPLETPAEFKDFQNELDDEITHQFIRLLTSLGGKDLQQSINNMLRRVMDDHLATSFSFSGKTMAGISKAAFCKTKVNKCLLVAAQQVFGLQNVTEHTFSTIVSKWLQQAKFRIEKRGKRSIYVDAEERNEEH